MASLVRPWKDPDADLVYVQCVDKLSFTLPVGRDADRLWNATLDD